MIVKVCLAATIVFAFAAGSASAMMNGLEGQWRGKGSAFVNSLGDIRAGCRFSVDETPTQVMMDGSCGIGPLRGSLGLKLNISDNGSVRGTYTGSRSGPAELMGRISGDTLRMQINWAGEVNGDLSAEMVLRRTGENSFSQTVIDQVDGQSRRTSEFQFVRQ
ncbi:MAG: hypothetical protein AAGI28_17230 [Pseudomonadota bacterium]